MVAVLQDEPMVVGVSADRFEAEFLVEGLRGLKVLHREAEAKVSKFHGSAFRLLDVERRDGSYSLPLTV